MNIRKATISDVSGLAKVHVDTWKTAYKGIISDNLLQNLSYKWSENLFLPLLNKQNDEATCFVAEHPAGHIIGFAIGGLERSKNPNYEGELWGIYVSTEHQRKGVGKLLVLAVVTKILGLHINSMLVWVLKDNPYRAFYESLGGKYVGEKPTQIGQEELVEVAYGWSDLNELFELLKRKKERV